MDITVLLSVVPDTTVRVTLSDEGVPALSEVPWVINPWDELALTRALELKEDPAAGVERVCVLHAGPAEHETLLRRALAMGADEAVRVDAVPGDAWSAAVLLVSWLREHPAALVLAGPETTDHGGGATGMMVAQQLGIAASGSVTAISVEQNRILFTREMDEGTETFAVQPPFLAVVQKGIAREPRMPSMRGLMMARRRPVTVVTPPSEETPLRRSAGWEMPPEKPPVKLIPPERAEEILDLLEKETRTIKIS